MHSQHVELGTTSVEVYSHDLQVVAYEVLGLNQVGMSAEARSEVGP